MKTLKLLLFSLTVLSTALFFSRCSLNEDIAKITDSLDSLQIIVGTPKFNTGVHIEFVDANTKEPISDIDVSVTITGKDAAFVHNNIGSKEITYTSSWGMLDLVIDPHQVDTNTIKRNPLEFELTANATGYLKNTSSVVINEQKKMPILIELVNINNLPEGMQVLTENTNVTTSAKGEITEDLVLDFGLTNHSSMNKIMSKDKVNWTQGVINIPKGTILLDYNGKPLVSGKLSASCWINEFPSSRNGNTKKPLKYTYTLRGNDYMSGTWFQPYAEVSYFLYVGYNEVYGFKGGIVKTYITIPSSFINPETNLPIKENDIIKGIQYRKLTTADKVYRNYPKSYKVQKFQLFNDNYEPQLVLIDTLNHGDPLRREPANYHIFGNFLPTCTNNLRFEFTGDNMYNTEAMFSHKIYKDQKLIDGVFSDRGYFKQGYINKRDIIALPEGRTEHVFENHNSNKDFNLVFSPTGFTIDNSCENKIYKVTVKDVPKGGVEYVTVNLSISLKSKSIVIKPNIPFVYRTVSEKYYTRAKELTNGEGTIKLKVGEKYIVGTYIGNTKAEGQVLIEKENETTYKITILPLLFGASSNQSTVIERKPRTGDKVIDINFTANLSDSDLSVFKK